MAASSAVRLRRAGVTLTFDLSTKKRNQVICVPWCTSDKSLAKIRQQILEISWKHRTTTRITDGRRHGRTTRKHIASAGAYRRWRLKNSPSFPGFSRAINLLFHRLSQQKVNEIMTFIKGHDDPVYPVNSCFTQIFEWRTKNTLLSIFPCTEFPEFSMFTEIWVFQVCGHPVYEMTNDITLPGTTWHVWALPTAECICPCPACPPGQAPQLHPQHLQ